MLFGRARLLNGQSSTPNSNRGCQPALYGTGRLAALASFMCVLMEISGYKLVSIVFAYCIYIHVQGSKIQASSRPRQPKNKWGQPRIEAWLSSWLTDFLWKNWPKNCHPNKSFKLSFSYQQHQQYENYNNYKHIIRYQNEDNQNNDEDNQIFNFGCPPTTNFRIELCYPDVDNRCSVGKSDFQTIHLNKPRSPVAIDTDLMVINSL